MEDITEKVKDASENDPGINVLKPEKTEENENKNLNEKEMDKKKIILKN